MTEDARFSAAQAWLSSLPLPGLLPHTLRPASADASFRRYLRVDQRQSSQLPISLVLMDAPPDKEPLDDFLAVADLLTQAGLHVPERLAVNPAEGFLLMEDLGVTHYQQALSVEDPSAAKGLYQVAWQALVRLQAWGRHHPQAISLPPYSAEKLLAEMQLFQDWYVTRHLGQSLDAREAQDLQKVYGLLIDRSIAQPQVIVHRDYHCRNLLVCPGHSPGVIDFQDAVLGPLTYDLVSLLRDAYIQWDEAEQLDWAIGYWTEARAAGLEVAPDFAEFWVDFEWMGLQRHLKVLGIFARLAYRDGKHQYLADLPVVLSYTQSVARRYIPLAPLRHLLERLHP